MAGTVRSDLHCEDMTPAAQSWLLVAVVAGTGLLRSAKHLFLAAMATVQALARLGLKPDVGEPPQLASRLGMSEFLACKLSRNENYRPIRP
jgi:hypothetical protein